MVRSGLAWASLVTGRREIIVILRIIINHHHHHDSLHLCQLIIAKSKSLAGTECDYDNRCLRQRPSNLPSVR